MELVKRLMPSTLTESRRNVLREFLHKVGRILGIDEFKTSVEDESHVLATRKSDNLSLIYEL